MTHLLLATSDPQVANTTYLWIYVALGVIGLIGAGVALRKYFYRQAVREAAIDALIHPDTGVMARLAALEKNLSPNGLDTEHIGDITKRTENAVKQVKRRLEQHIGEERESRRLLWAAVERKQDRETVG